MTRSTPTFRWFLYDGLKRYSVPLTIFGPLRAPVFIGEIGKPPGSIQSLYSASRRNIARAPSLISRTISAAD